MLTLGETAPVELLSSETVIKGTHSHSFLMGFNKKEAKQLF